jgi:hypothetical protein
VGEEAIWLAFCTSVRNDAVNSNRAAGVARDDRLFGQDATGWAVPPSPSGSVRLQQPDVGPVAVRRKTLFATMHSNAKLRPRISVLAAQVGLAVEPSRPTQASNACSVSSSPTNRPLSLVATLHGLGMMPSAFPATRLTPSNGLIPPR